MPETRGVVGRKRVGTAVLKWIFWMEHYITVSLV